MTQTTRDGRFQQGSLIIDDNVEHCIALTLIFVRLLPEPPAPSKPPTSPQYSFILPNQGEPFSFAVLRCVPLCHIWSTSSMHYCVCALMHCYYVLHNACMTLYNQLLCKQLFALRYYIYCHLPYSHAERVTTSQYSILAVLAIVSQ